MSKRIASCSCRQLKAAVSAEPIRISVCHCLACQRRTGSVFGVQARFPIEAVEVTGQGAQFVRISDEGSKTTFTFCPQCGATVFYVMAALKEFIAIPVGAFADPSFPAPSLSIYEDRMHSWVQMPKDMEHMA
jgi:hypothetical protein